MNKQPDFATGKLVDIDRPEEQVRQDYERQLVEGYGYPRECLDIEVRIPRGSSHSERADLAVYRSPVGRDPVSDIDGLVEFKRPDRSDGTAQLKSYMTATSARWGVWTNGTDISYVCRDPQDPARLLDGYLHNIPACGQEVADVGKLNKAELEPFGRAELKIVFRRILNKLYANAQIARRDQLGSEMVKLLFAKIEDETTYADRPPDFRVQAGESPARVSERVGRLFERAVETLRDDDIFTEHDTISLDADSVAEVVGQLERGSLTRTDTDVVGDAFEVFAESRLAGERGQFFTPRSVVRLAVQLTDPQPGQAVCDPACGSGGFLIHAMRHVWGLMDAEGSGRWGSGADLEGRKRRMAASNIFGVDKEVDLVKIAKAYMAISGDGRSNIKRGDSLRAAADSAEYDVVLTNPPFGTKSKVQKSLSKHFELGHGWKLDDGVWTKTADVRACDPYLLFVERCIRLTRRGGTLAIVLPETVFHAPSLAYVRSFIRLHGSVEAIVDLPHNSFRPHCNAKTCLLVLRRGVRQGRIIMATPAEIGHDLQGKPLYRPGSEDLWDDLAVVADELADPADPENELTFVVPAEAIDVHDCWTPAYHRGLANPPAVPEGCGGVSLGELVADKTIEAFNGHGSPRASEKGRGDIPYIRVNDVVNWELYHNPVAGVPVAEYQRLKADRRPARVDDVLMVRRGSYRIGTVAIAGPRDARAVLTSELLTFRVKHPNRRGITPAYLLAMLSTPEVQIQIPPRVCVDTTLPNLGDRWRTIVVPIHTDEAERTRISDQAAAIIDAKRRAWEKTSDLAARIGCLKT
ncbi:MAG: N-6 DNA methylase [bacterium]|nr:N-6 DNA methylase [bacterium]